MPHNPWQRFVALAASSACVLTGLITFAPAAQAATSDLIINEVYGGGGNSGATYTNDFVELYNPTGAAVDLTGVTVKYYSASGNLGNTCTLTGSVPANSYFLVQQAAGTGGTTPLPTPDATCTAAMSGSNGIVELSDANGVVDLVGYGTASRFEGAAAAPGLSNTTSASRTGFADTDQNGDDFTAGAPTPQNSGAPTDPGPGPDPDPEPDPEFTSIAAIQGTGDATPLAGQRVVTKGVVTAAYPTGGFGGIYIQTPGTGGTPKAAGDASDGIFVYSSSAASSTTIGACVSVEGTAGEYNGLTQLSGTPVVTALAATECEAVIPTPLATLPATDADKEPYEGMLVAPQGTYTITNNYALNQYGQLGLAVGDEPLYQATDVVRPGEEAAAYEAANLRKLITLDDGSSWNYLTNNTAKNTPLPYLSHDEPMRTASQVTFDKPVILDYRFQWNYQPTGQVIGSTSEYDPVVSENDREATVPAVGGEIQLAAFNVLNYFNDLGQNEEGCRAYTDREGNPVATNNCQVRGAYTPEAFADQQAKLVAAINGTQAEVVGLMEIENSAGLSYIDHPRDAALANLVDALNADAGETRWAYAPSPTVTPTNEDVIRTAFIYDPRAVELVGPSFIDQHDAFANARYPLAQEFAAVDGGTSFVAVANHFKSKGSGEDDGTGQGLSNPSREAQARQLTAWAEEMFAGKPVFLLGDFNAYSKETPVQIIEAAGYKNTAKHFEPTSATYQFSGRLGSLDHIFANEAAMELVTGAAVWDINGDESIAFQYSRRNYNVTDFHRDDQYASSDHDAVLVGIEAGAPPADPVVVVPSAYDCNSFGFSVTGAPEGAKLRIEWERSGQKQYTTVNSLTWWSGDGQAGWMNAVATVLGADGTVLATSGDPINPAACTVTATAYDCNSFGFSFEGAPAGSKLYVEWTRDGQKQYTTVNSLTWWSGNGQAGWSNAIARVLDAGGKVYATSGDPINPEDCPVITPQRVTDKAFGFAVDPMPEGTTLKITWTDRKGNAQVTTTTQASWWSGNNKKGWRDARAVLLDAKGEVIAKSGVINP